MAQFVRIGVLVVDLEQCAFESVDGPAICVYTQGRTFGPYPEKSEMYRVLEAWMSQQPDLADVVEHEDAKRLFAEPDFVENDESTHECYECGDEAPVQCSRCDRWCCVSHSSYWSFEASGQQVLACERCTNDAQQLANRPYHKYFEV